MIKSQELKRIGIIGGLGPDSTLDYYRAIINYFRSDPEDLNYPEILIYSVNLTEFMSLVSNRKDYLVKYMLEKINVLHHAGADFVAIASNTPHIIFDKLREKSPVPLISIIEETLDYANQIGLKRLGLLGTKITMGTDLYTRPFKACGIDVFVPDDDEREFIHEKIFSELEIGIVKEKTREQFLGFVKKMIENHKIEGLILGCTELPLMFPDAELNIPFINTTKLHIDSIIKYSINKL